jgi:hypothetical protein
MARRIRLVQQARRSLRVCGHGFRQHASFFARRTASVSRRSFPTPTCGGGPSRGHSSSRHRPRVGLVRQIAIHLGVRRSMDWFSHFGALGIRPTLPALRESSSTGRPDRHRCKSNGGRITPDRLTRTHRSVPIFSPASPRRLHSPGTANLSNSTTPRRKRFNNARACSCRLVFAGHHSAWAGCNAGSSRSSAR